MTRRNLILISALLILAVQPLVHVQAQVVDCNVQLNYESVQTTYKDQLANFASDIKDYLGNYNWGGGSTDDKVKCTLNIFVQTASGDNRYVAQVFIGSQRQIFNSDQSTVVVRLFDESWEFTYIKGRPINHNSYSFNDLSSFLDFYMYLIMGYDFDTYDKFSGTPLFKKAADVASLGRSSGQKGWQPATGSYSKSQLIDELLSPKFEPVRAASWAYHFTGVDSFAINKERAFGNLLQALESIGLAKREVNPQNIVIKSFFEAKYMEIANIFSSYPDPSIYIKFSLIDPSHQNTYEEFRTKKK